MRQCFCSNENFRKSHGMLGSTQWVLAILASGAIVCYALTLPHAPTPLRRVWVPSVLCGVGLPADYASSLSHALGRSSFFPSFYTGITAAGQHTVHSPSTHGRTLQACDGGHINTVANGSLRLMKNASVTPCDAQQSRGSQAAACGCICVYRQGREKEDCNAKRRAS